MQSAGLSGTQLYYQRRQLEATTAPGDSEIRQQIQDIAVAYPTYGYRRMTAQLRRQGVLVNHKRGARLMDEMGLKVKVKRWRCRTTNSGHAFPHYPNRVAGLTVTAPDEVWMADITYVRLHQEFVYLAVIMDVFSRAIRGWHLGRTLDQSLTLTALQRALAHGQTPRIHHSDQGVQYAATAYIARLEQAGVSISMAEVGQAWQNGYAERLMRTIKEEKVDLSHYLKYVDPYSQLGHFLDEVYMHKRIHSALGYLTPVEFEAQWLSLQPSSDTVIQEQYPFFSPKNGVTTDMRCHEFWIVG